MRGIDGIPNAKLQNAVDESDDRVGVVSAALNIHCWVPRKETTALHKVDVFFFQKEWVATVAAREVVETR